MNQTNINIYNIINNPHPKSKTKFKLYNNNIIGSNSSRAISIQESFLFQKSVLKKLDNFNDKFMIANNTYSSKINNNSLLSLKNKKTTK